MNETVSEDALSDEADGKSGTAKKGSVLWREVRGIAFVLFAVLLFHSLIAKPFYIPSESMMPGLLTGDRLVVSKYPYGWSWVSPSFHVLPPMKGRVAAKTPRRGDIVIVTPVGTKVDWIKRVIGLPGDTISMIDGNLIINGKAVIRTPEPDAIIPIDSNSPCGSPWDPTLADHRSQDADGRVTCHVPVVRETLPNGVSYDTVELGPRVTDNFGPITIPDGHVWLMGDNRDDSADSRVPASEGGLGGPIPLENVGGRAEFITFSLDGSTKWWNPVSWFTAFRPGRAGRSLRS